MKALRFALLLGLLGIPFGILGRMIYLDGYYYSTAPRVRDAATGAVVPVQVHHGTTVFLTNEQWRSFDSPTAVNVQILTLLAGAAAAFVLNRRWNIFKDQRDAG